MFLYSNNLSPDLRHVSSIYNILNVFLTTKNFLYSLFLLCSFVNHYFYHNIVFSANINVTCDGIKDTAHFHFIGNIFVIHNKGLCIFLKQNKNQVIPGEISLKIKDEY